MNEEELWQLDAGKTNPYSVFGQPTLGSMLNNGIQPGPWAGGYSFPQNPYGPGNLQFQLPKAPGGGGLLKSALLAASKLNPWIAGGTAALGGIQTIAGMIGANKLSKTPWPEYTASPELQAAKSRSSQRSQTGFTPQQTGAFRANLASMLNADYRNAINMAGGSLAGAITARNTGSRLRALNQFAVDDANQMARNIAYDDSITNQLQSLRNMNTQTQLQRRMALEQAYGGAIRSGTTNLANYFNLGAALRAGV